MALRPNSLEELESICEEYDRKTTSLKEELDMLKEKSIIHRRSHNRASELESHLNEASKPDAYRRITIVNTYLVITRAEDVLKEIQHPERKERYLERLRTGGRENDKYRSGIYTSRKEDIDKQHLQLADTETVQKFLGEDLELYVDSKIPVIAYTSRGNVIGLEHRQEEIPLSRPQRLPDRSSQIKDKIRAKLEGFLNTLNRRRMQELVELKKNISSSPEQLNENIFNLKREYKSIIAQKNYLSGLLGFNKTNNLLINRKLLMMGDDYQRGHFVCFGEEPVARWKSDNLCHIIYTPSVAKPMKMRLIELPPEFESFIRLRAGSGFESGDYFGFESGHRIIDSEEIDELFKKVQDGIEILPEQGNQKTGRGFKERKPRGENKVPPKPRHWGQEHLGTLATEKVVEGEFFATGLFYQAFPINDVVVVEANQENTATYVFDKSDFERLRNLPRSRIMSETPEGYKGRAIHRLGKDEWTKRLDEILR